jgi:eukaryotic-like serine/threonine-protein kinase
MDPGSEQRQLPAGTMLDEKYRVESLLAVGGMGAVYVGTHTKLRKRVAIKVLNPQLSTPQMIERFHREAITASQVGHEGIAQVTDLGTSVDGEPFLVMELLEGESLGKRLRATGPLPIHEACELACSILAPLGAAHRAGIVHRDLKPDNVFLVQQSRGEMVKLLDFGISRATGLDDEFRLTTTGLVLGTPFYMSPEQAQGASSITPASDLYSLGVMLYEMLIGKVPIQGDNYNQLMYHVVNGAFTPPRQLRADVPPALERVVLRAMSLSPEHRPASAAELEHDLLIFCRPTFRAHLTEGGASPRLSLVTPAPRLTGAAGSPGVPALASPSGIGIDQTMMATADRQLLGHAAAAAAGHSGPSTHPGHPSHAGHAPPARSRALLLAALGGAIVAAGVAAAVLIPGSPPSPPASPAVAAAPAAPTAPTTPPAPAAAIPAPTPPAASATIRLRFEVEPDGAEISVDGKPVAGAELEVPRDEAAHSLRVAAAGFVAEEEQIRFDESQRLVVRLKPEPKEPGTRRPRPERPPETPRRPQRPERIDSDSPYKQ